MTGKAKMKESFTDSCCRWKSIGPDGVVSAALLLTLTFILLSPGAWAQTSNKPTGTTNSTSLPLPFAQFSPSDVFKQIFAGYDPATGRISGILNEVKSLR